MIEIEIEIQKFEIQKLEIQKLEIQKIDIGKVRDSVRGWENRYCVKFCGGDDPPMVSTPP